MGMASVIIGILGFILFKWTPDSTQGLLAYGVLLAVLILMVGLSMRGSTCKL